MISCANRPTTMSGGKTAGGNQIRQHIKGTEVREPVRDEIGEEKKDVHEMR